MANTHGGYRKPANPAPVSGPGKYSKRTDGQPGQVISTAPNQDYGEAKQQAAEQAIAPMGAATPMPPAANVSAPSQPDQGPQMPQYAGGDFAGPTQRPDEHIMTMPTSLPTPDPTEGQQGTGRMTQLLTQLAATANSGILAQLRDAAAARNV